MQTNTGGSSRPLMVRRSLHARLKNQRRAISLERSCGDKVARTYPYDAPQTLRPCGDLSPPSRPRNFTQLRIVFPRMKLVQNVGGVDRVIRLVGGAALIGAGIYLGQIWLAIIGGVLFLTGLVGRCGLYYLIGVNTCPPKKS